MERHQSLIFDAVLAAGFDLVGALPIEEAGDERVREWLARDLHGEMAYLERHAAARENPAASFPEFRTLVVTAMEYGSGEPPRCDPATGNISRYALGEDYHALLKHRLKTAARSIWSTAPEVRTRIFVDTGPINEKRVAELAGLGWTGKHTNLISPKRGSYLFLGLLLVSVELPRSGPRAADRCGTCTACIPACPTGAIIAPHVLDARLCISYLTIELKGPIPRELRPLIGNRIFGCDDCQEVCPWNKFARKVRPPPFESREGLRDRTLDEWLQMNPQEWSGLIDETALMRPGYRGFMRNVLVAAGCSGEAAIVDRVATFLEHAEPLLRSHAAWALGHLGTREAANHLRQARETEQTSEVSSEIEDALLQTRNDR